MTLPNQQRQRFGLGGAGRPIKRGLQLWLDASDASTVFQTAGSVTDWRDKSGKANHLHQGTGSRQPDTDATQANGLNVIDWDGNHFILLPSSLFLIPNNNYTMFFVAKRASEDASTDYLIQMSDGATITQYLRYTSTSGQTLFVSRNTDANQVAFSGATNTDVQIFTFGIDGTTQSLNVNGGTAVTNTSAQFEDGIDAAAIASNSAGTGNRLIGSIAEILIYNREFSAQEIKVNEDYLADKWGITLA